MMKAGDFGWTFISSARKSISNEQSFIESSLVAQICSCCNICALQPSVCLSFLILTEEVHHTYQLFSVVCVFLRENLPHTQETSVNIPRRHWVYSTHVLSDSWPETFDNLVCFCTNQQNSIYARQFILQSNSHLDTAHTYNLIYHFC